MEGAIYIRCCRLETSFLSPVLHRRRKNDGSGVDGISVVYSNNDRVTGECFFFYTSRGDSERILSVIKREKQYQMSSPLDLQPVTARVSHPSLFTPDKVIDCKMTHRQAHNISIGLCVRIDFFALNLLRCQGFVKFLRSLYVSIYCACFKNCHVLMVNIYSSINRKPK